MATVDESGVVTAVGDGRATLTAKADERSVSTVIEVERASATYPVSFRNHVVPVLTKAGCNSGPCHGAAAGKNGFKLTLRGYDPELDYLTLTRQAGARRINKVDPATSLMLLKPTVAVSHGGGKRFSPRSPEYRVIADWIASGTPAPAEWRSGDDATGSVSRVRALGRRHRAAARWSARTSRTATPRMSRAG